MQGPRLLFIFISILATLLVGMPGAMAVSDGSVSEESFAPLDPSLSVNALIESPDWIQDIIDAIKGLPGDIWDFVVGEIQDAIEWTEDTVVSIIGAMEASVWAFLYSLAGPAIGEGSQITNSARVIMAVLYVLAVFLVIRIYVLVLDLIPMI